MPRSRKLESSAPSGDKKAAGKSASTSLSAPVRQAVQDWFAQRGWKPFTFQSDVWKAMRAGRSGMLHATTGAGKTYAVWLGALQSLARGKLEARPTHPPPLTVLWITPMKALAADTFRALCEPLESIDAALGGALGWTVGMRTGDTGSAERSAQSKRLPTVLVTTPESLSLMLARADARAILSCVELIIADEWHELLASKRGVQAQLAVARLKTWNPSLMIWGMSATLGNLDEALDVLTGALPDATAVLVRGKVPKKLIIDTLLPDKVERFPWAGHLGLTMLPAVVKEIDASSTTLVFTNTRSQAEIWYRALLEAKPEWAGVIALHHGSLDREVREWVERGLKVGELRAVVCTSSLDLGVDFLPVERVLQIGSPKGVARLLQRAGRSGHAPGRASRITLVPTHSLELVEAAAARQAVKDGEIESRPALPEPLDVLVQHLVTVALGGGFEPEALYQEVRTAWSYKNLSRESWQWCLDFVKQGGPSLAAYPDYQRVVPDEEGIWRVPDARLARRHRMNVGTITSDASMSVSYWSQGGSGARIGSIEESFIARLKPGDVFLFGGKSLELVRVHQMIAFVKRAKSGSGSVPRWNGGRMPLSTTLADAMVRELEQAAQDHFDSPEMKLVRPLLELQAKWSSLPGPDKLVAEVFKSREGWHLFMFPFAGRHVHLGLASLIAWRVAKHEANTFSMAVNDYGFELLSAEEVDWAALLRKTGADSLFANDKSLLLADVLASLNASELARRRFRDIARVSGLVYQGYPGEKRSNRQLQASSQLFFEVFRKYDPENQLLLQAQQELLSQELEIGRLATTLERMNKQTLTVMKLERPSPFGFPLMVERFREKLTNESLSDRVARMVQQLEKAAQVS